MSESKPFIPLEDPYKDVPDEHKQRISCDIPISDKLVIQGICPVRGILQSMVNTFIESVANECRQRNISTYDQYDELIALIKRRTAPCPVGNGHGVDDLRATASAHNQAPEHPAECGVAKAKPRVAKRKAVKS